MGAPEGDLNLKKKLSGGLNAAAGMVGLGKGSTFNPVKAAVVADDSDEEEQPAQNAVAENVAKAKAMHLKEQEEKERAAAEKVEKAATRVEQAERDAAVAAEAEKAAADERAAAERRAAELAAA